MSKDKYHALDKVQSDLAKLEKAQSKLQAEISKTSIKRRKAQNQKKIIIGAIALKLLPQLHDIESTDQIEYYLASHIYNI